MQLPVAVVGQALATAALPTLARLWSEGKREKLDARDAARRSRWGSASRCSRPARARSSPRRSSTVVYRRGAFGADDAQIVSALLRVFSVSVPAWVVQQIAVRAFYARGDTWRPMLLGTAVSVGAIPLYLALGPRWGAAGLAWAGVLAMGANALGTLLLALRLHGAPRLGALAASGARSLVIAALAGAAGAATQLGRPGLTGALLDLGLGFAVFGAVALALVFVLGDAPLRDAMRRQVRRLVPKAAGPVA